jgi:hypothetical protein
MTTRYVDFHCHLDLFKDMDSAVRDADAAGIYTLTVTTTPKAWPRNRDLARQTKRAYGPLSGCIRNSLPIVLLKYPSGKNIFRRRAIPAKSVSMPVQVITDPSIFREKFSRAF